jgi:hypothetical protein
VVVRNYCGCAQPQANLPPGKVLFDRTLIDLGFVQGLQGAMNTAPMAGGPGDCGLSADWYTFDFMTLEGVVVQSYATAGNCYATKYTLGIPPFGLVDGYLATDVAVWGVAYHGTYLFDALHHDIGLPD